MTLQTSFSWYAIFCQYKVHKDRSRFLSLSLSICTLTDQCNINTAVVFVNSITRYFIEFNVRAWHRREIQERQRYSWFPLSHTGQTRGSERRRKNGFASFAYRRCRPTVMYSLTTVCTKREIRKRERETEIHISLRYPIISYYLRT